MQIDPKKETKKIIKFIQGVQKNSGLNKVVIGLSGGIDSATCLYLLKKSIPVENIIVTHLYYFAPENLSEIIKDIPNENVHNISIKKTVDDLAQILNINNYGKEILKQDGYQMVTRQVQDDRVRFGNITARIRMIILFDLAKKYNALVCGTENKSEHLLGYFTRFGDEASDFEPIMHLYKDQVYQLAKNLSIPKEIIKKAPSANLWENQTDEKELGFSYEEADQVLKLYFDEKISLEEIEKKGFKNAEKILNVAEKNKFKHLTPYHI